MARSPTALSTSAALMAVSSTIGGIIPPSIIMILIASSLSLSTPTMMPGMKPAENRAPTAAGPFGWMLSRLGALNLRTLQGALHVARPGSGLRPFGRRLRRRTGGVTTPINRPTETMIAVQIAMTALYELSPLMVSYTLEIIWNMFIVGFGIFLVYFGWIAARDTPSLFWELGNFSKTYPMLIIPITGFLIALASTAVIIEDIVYIRKRDMTRSYFEHHIKP